VRGDSGSPLKRKGQNMTTTTDNTATEAQRVLTALDPKWSDFQARAVRAVRGSGFEDQYWSERVSDLVTHLKEGDQDETEADLDRLCAEWSESWTPFRVDHLEDLYNRLDPLSISLVDHLVWDLLEDPKVTEDPSELWAVVLYWAHWSVFSTVVSLYQGSELW
jgi:hypothetical protein